MKIPLFVHLTVHEKGEQVIVHAEAVINFIQISVLPFHKQIDLILRQHHLHQVGLDASCIGNKVDVLPFCRIVADKPHIKLAHAGIVVVHLRNDDLVDKLEVDAGGKALLRE